MWVPYVACVIEKASACARVPAMFPLKCFCIWHTSGIWEMPHERQNRSWCGTQTS